MRRNLDDNRWDRRRSNKRGVAKSQSSLQASLSGQSPAYQGSFTGSVNDATSTHDDTTLGSKEGRSKKIKDILFGRSPSSQQPATTSAVRTNRPLKTGQNSASPTNARDSRRRGQFRNQYDRSDRFLGSADASSDAIDNDNTEGADSNANNGRELSGRQNASGARSDGQDGTGSNTSPTNPSFGETVDDATYGETTVEGTLGSILSDNTDKSENDDNVSLDETDAEEGKNNRNVGVAGRNNPNNGGYDEATVTTRYWRQNPMKRYRGFTTSISGLFLDEQIVCGAMSCCGLLLSSRTEHLLNKRNQRRGLTRRGSKAGGQRTPSRILSISLILTIILVLITYVIWGFNSSLQSNVSINVSYDDVVAGDDAVAYDDASAADEDEGDNEGADDDQDDDDNAEENDDGEADDGNRRRQLYGLSSACKRITHGSQDTPIWGITKIRDYHDYIWCPMGDFMFDASFLFKKAWIEAWNDLTRNNIIESMDNKSEGRRQMETSSSHVAQMVSSRGVLPVLSHEHKRYLAEGNNQAQYVGDLRDIGGTVRIVLVVLFLVLLGIVGRRRRMRTRFAILRARAQEDHLYFTSHPAAPPGLDNMDSASFASPVSSYADDTKREDKYDGACSHTLCGCYPIDPVQYIDEDGEEYTIADNGANPRVVQKKKHKGSDFISRLFTCMSSCCCGFLCKCWIQCCSICALAQEARETRLLLPPKLQRVDYITHQPFHDYQPAVNDLRRKWMGKGGRRAGWGGIMPHIKALSTLSRHIIFTFVLVAITVTLTLVFNPRSNFSWHDAIVIIATFVQSFIVLFIVFWIFHKSDLSFDAVVKFFAAGFVVAVPAAFLIEFIMLNTFFAMSYSVYAIIDYFTTGDGFSEYIDNNYEVFWIIGEVIHAFIVASTTEELCKYYAFRTIEHPDLIFLTGLDRATNEVVASLGGGYAYDSHQISASTSRSEDDSVSVSTRSSWKSRSSRGSRRSRRKKSGLNDDSSQASMSLRSVDTEEEYYEDDTDLRSHRQRAMAITTGMISVAVGLACAENFVYVFFFNGFDEIGEQKRTQDEWLVLFFRSIFPVHALAAAMQSIGLIKKFIEPRDDDQRGIGVGRIVFPAILLHGTFDAILMSINVYTETSYEEFYANGQDGEAYNAIILNAVVALSLITIMAMSSTWYYIQNRRQSRRLKLMEQEDGTYDDSTSCYSQPSLSQQSNLV